MSLRQVGQGKVGPQPYLNQSGFFFQDGEFLWNKKIQGIILGSFFWGYLLTQIPGGWLATKIGGKRVYGYSMLGATIATLLTPVAADAHYIVLVVLRVIVGITSVSIQSACMFFNISSFLHWSITI